MNIIKSPAVILLVLFCCCNNDKKTISTPADSIHFTLIPSSESNVKFSNTITENDSVNLIYNAYTYMGSGVGIGDFNNDGLQDFFIGANQESSRLYINKGQLQFEDLTKKAGVKTSGWVTGISIADINNDGYDDIYVCISGNVNSQKRSNLLFINNGDLTFTEQAAAYGLDDTSYSTQAVFLDYDRDGDLDMYLLNHLLNHQQSNFIVKPDRSGHSPAQDKLYRNEGIKEGESHPYFTEVSMQAGIREDGFGLGVAVCDFNKDNWPDLYVANDYLANDILWINNQDGTFRNSIAAAIRHQSYSSMGVDAADINNDALPDLISLDMLPEDNYRKKMMYSFMSYERYSMERKAGYEPQFIRNMLQLNNGNGNLPDTTVPSFSEIGRLAGIAETDWSWSVLMADFDNDGWKDVHITNGLGRDMINSDFIAFYSSATTKSNGNFKETYNSSLKKLASYGTVELNNYCFKNNKNLHFSDVSAESGIGKSAISNGCAYADFDNDGDLDLIVNNINKGAFLLRNDARANSRDSSRNFISAMLKGDSLNKNGFGAKLFVYTRSTLQLIEQNPARGYLSTVDKRLTTGIGNSLTVDSVKIFWPDGKQQTALNIPANTVLTLDYRNAILSDSKTTIPAKRLFTDISGMNGIEFTHMEHPFDDYAIQQLLPQKYSQLGPFLADGDINGDGLIDFFIGGALKQSGRFFIQQKDGSFRHKDLIKGDKSQEDLGCSLFDADGDKDLDLVVIGGSNEYRPGNKNYLPRLYKNDGSGNFSLDDSAFPAGLLTSAQSVAGADYDGDGDIDLFIGGRITPGQYPAIPESFLLENNGGRFSNIVRQTAPTLQYPGMITSSIWTDLNNDKKPDLVIAGEWMPIRFFLNESGKLVESTESTGLANMKGLWRSLSATDIDNDGDIDIIAGNLGLNHKYKVSPVYPVKLYAKDLDENGSVDPLIFYHIKNEKAERILYPSINRDQFAAQVPAVKKKFLYHTDYAKTDINTIFSDTDRDKMMELTCNETRSVWLENTGKGGFKAHPLPTDAQFAPVNSIICEDVDNDGNPDLILAGNEYQTEVMTGRYDASYGIFLKGDGKGNFAPIQPAASGLWLQGDVKDTRLLKTSHKKQLLLTAINNEALRTYELSHRP